MSPVPAATQKLIAILGLIAVVFGALEHEDLIFQNPPAHEIDVELGSATVESMPISHFGDSGTEGTFQLPGHRFWLLPTQEVIALLRSSHSRLARQVWWWRIGARRQASPSSTGPLVLRL